MTIYKGGPFPSAWHVKRGLALVVALFVLNGGFYPLIYQQLEETLWKLGSESDSFILHDDGSTWSSPAWSLVEETRAAIRTAGGVPRSSLSSAQGRAWDAAHPCASRLQLLPLWNRHKKPTFNESLEKEPSQFLRILFNEYANLHRTCTHGGDMAYVTKLFRSRDDSGHCRFLVVEFGTYGVGNRLLWLVSSFLYALLTQRVLLLDTRSTVHSLLCEPFPGSSWQLPYNFPYSSDQRWTMPEEFQQEWDVWENRTLETDEGLEDLSKEEIERETRETKAFILEESQRDGLSSNNRRNVRKMASIEYSEGKLGGTTDLPMFHHVQANDGWAPNPRFFCDSEQERLKTVKWVSLSSGCLYFLPDLFAVPSVQPVLEELFPDRDPLTHLVRRLSLPVDHIWKEVRRFYNTDVERASKVVGMQVRYRDGAPMYKTLNDVVNTRINRCATQHGLIPSPADLLAQINVSDGPVLIFIASLYSGLEDHLRKVYEENMQGVKILQLSKLGFQSFDLDADNQAFAEIICLSLSDELLTSPQSTYGQIAQGYGGLKPWLIQFDPQASSDCVRGQSTDACYQFPVANFVCPFNRQVDGKAMADVVPYLRPCQDSDGLQLVPPWTNTSIL